jgi:hypothetical protein
MRYRVVAVWGLLGIVVAIGWSLYAAVMMSHVTDPLRQVWALATLTCPVLLLRSFVSLSLSVIFAANFCTYALGGLILEAFSKYRSRKKR